MKFLIVADPIESLHAKSDSGLSMAREALQRGHQVLWATPDELRLYHNRVWVKGRPILACNEAELPEQGAPGADGGLTDFDGVWIRKDPPFDTNYLSMCWLLSLEEAKVPIINAPSQLLQYHEKLLPYIALQAGALNAEELIPTWIISGKQPQAPENFPVGPVVTKPWLGYGGHDVMMWDSVESAIEALRSSEPQASMLQPYLPQVKESGDRRVIFVDGTYAGDVVRTPSGDSIRANLVQGGRASERPMSKAEQDLTKRLGRFLKSIGIGLAGADYIDAHLTEINITAPTGFEAIAALGQSNPRIAYLDLAERLVKERS